jgi:virginiamycin B lyase
MRRLVVTIAVLGVAGCSAVTSPPSPVPAPAAATGSKRKPQIVEHNAGTQIVRFPIPTAGVVPFRIIANGSNFWFTEQGQAGVGSITPAGVITNYPLGTGGAGSGSTLGLTLGADHNAWFTSGASVARSAGSGPPVQFTLPIPATIANATTPCPTGIAAGSDGALWFTDPCNTAVGRITIDGSTIAEYALPSANAAPFDIVAGPDKNLWVTEAGSGKLARIVPANAAITEFALPQAGLAPQYITSANDALWFTFTNYAGVGTMTTAGRATLFPGADIFTGIAKGPDNSVWMSDFAAQGLAIFTTAKAYANPISLGTQAVGLVTGSDKNLWFTDGSNNSIDVYVPFPQTVSATSIAFNLVGETQTFSASESGNAGATLTATSSNAKVASVVPSAVGQWTVTAVAAGTCTISVRDQYANSTSISVAVTTETFVIQ